MADTKITALAAIGANPINVATFPIPMVDLLDTSMAASGTTKKVTVNQILGAGGTATLASATISGAATVGTTLGVTGASTLASATITGDLTVDTNVLKVDTTLNRVGIGTASPIAGSSLDVRGAVGTGTDIQSLTLIDTSALAINNGGGLSFGYVFESPSTVIGRAGYIKTIKENATDGNYASAMVFGVTANGAATAERYRIGSNGTSTWSVAGTTAMTLNSTGLLVGTTSDLTGANISSSKGLGTANIATNRFATVEYGSGAGGAFTTITISVAVPNTVASVIIEVLLTGFSGVYLDHVAGRYSTQTPVVIRNNASVGTTVAALAVDGAGLIYTLTITTSVQNPVVKVKATAGGLAGSIALPVITFA